MITRKLRTSLIASTLMVWTVASPADATVLTGPITRVPEGTGHFVWTPAGAQFSQQWSFANENAGYAYGRNYSTVSNADVALVFNMTDPTRMTNAQELTYSRDWVYFGEGDTVFFRNGNGQYGAWRIDRIDRNSTSSPLGYLYGQWYIQTNGTGNFTVPEPTSLAGLAVGTLLLRRRR